MSEKDDGGAAFPGTGESDGQNAYPHEVHQTGMTLRDYFAAKAMQAIVTIADQLTAKDGSPVNEDHCASQAYHLADAMLKARNK